MYWLDTREGELIRLLQAPQDIVKQLPVADIWIGITESNTISEGGLLIERKSIRDLEASILDGRYREQRGRLLASCHENKTQPMYIVEGSFSSGTGRLTKKALMKFINRLIFHYNIAVMQTASINETAELIQTLAEQWKEDPSSLQRTTELVKVTDGIHVQKKANAMDPRQFAICCIAQCPGVSVKAAEQLVTTFGSLPGVIQATKEEIEKVKVGARKIGPVVSKRLYELLHHL
jgi:ERCC4-type nuclease|uniref:ERCC4 domain-containing protein n=1 Tax=viral metagenome TaxID=1070528 RepID=A0A6C0BI20_9ZZZZ